jgi:hypothetical protein
MVRPIKELYPLAEHTPGLHFDPAIVLHSGSMLHLSMELFRATSPPQLALNNAVRISEIPLLRLEICSGSCYFLDIFLVAQKYLQGRLAKSMIPLH